MTDDNAYDPFFDNIKIDTDSYLVAEEASLLCSDGGEVPQSAPTATIDLPDRFSLKKEASLWVADQKRTKACTAFSVVAAIEGALLIQNPTTRSEDDKKKKEFQLSESFLYYAARVHVAGKSPNYLGGLTIGSAVTAAEKHGVCRSSLWKFDASQLQTPPSKRACKDAEQRKVLRKHSLGPKIDDIKYYLAIYKCPVVAAYRVYPNHFFRKVRRTGKIPFPGGGDEKGGHAICIFGYNDDRGVFVFKNSWGTDWGDGGWGEIPYQLVLKTDRWAIEKVSMPLPPLRPRREIQRKVYRTKRFYIVSVHGSYLTMCCGRNEFKLVHLHDSRCEHSIWEWYTPVGETEDDRKYGGSLCIRNVATGRYLRGAYHHQDRRTVDSAKLPWSFERWYTRKWNGEEEAFYIINALSWSRQWPSYLRGDPSDDGTGEILLTHNTRAREKWRFIRADDNDSLADRDDPLHGRTFYIKNINSGLVLDIHNAELHNGANIQIQGLHHHHAQRWRFERIGTVTQERANHPVYNIINPGTNKALDVAYSGNENGTNVHLWERNGTGAQEWMWIQSERALVNPDSNKALDVNECGVAAETNVQIWERNQGPAQRWKLFDAHT